MITNSTLGFSGRLGNQMFQYAMLVGIKYKHGSEIILDEDISKKSIYGFCELTEYFTLKECHFYNKRDIIAPHIFEEERFHFDSRFFKKISDNMDFHGYFQSEKYFEHCKDAVRKEFTFKPHIVAEAEKFLEPYKDKHLVSIHIRRGDYVPQPNFHPVCSIEYYKEAMKLFDDVQFVVFSDDISWCKENFAFKNVVYSENTSGVDMCIMSKCHDNIIANSTFSWWASWLNDSPSKKIVAPKIWFGPFYSHYDTSDLYQKNWILV